VSSFLTVEEAARFLRLSPRTLNKFRIEGRGPEFRKHGRRCLYALADLEAWSAERRRTSTSDPGPAEA